jgi:hypothetical protein
MELIRQSIKHTLSQLKDCIHQMDETNFVEPVELLSGNTIGKHSRHIIELFQCLINQESKGVINYDDRAHSKIIETSVVLSSNAIDEILTGLNQIASDKPLSLISCSDLNGGTFMANTSLLRELQYNVEHAIHHMAIIQIAIKHHFKNLSVPKDFGVAYSTIKFQEAAC